MSSQKHPKSDNNDTAEILNEAESLINQFKTVQMATLTPKGNPEASYTPYIRLNGHYYIFISDLASHTENIRQHPTLSLFFIQNESEAKNLFARKRFTIECTGTQIERENSEWANILNLFQDEHGSTVALLRTLPDFTLFKLTPISGTYIKGFGQAFKLEGDKLQEVSQITGK